MSPRTEEDNQMIRDERREQILQAALKVFGHKGFAAAKISDIAAAAGLSHGLFYHYFDSKDQIFKELVITALEGSTGTFKAAFETPGSPWDRIRSMTEMLVPKAYEGIGPYYFNIMFEAMISDAVSQEVKDLIIKKAPYYEYLVPLIIEGQKEGQVVDEDPLQLATAYLSLIQGLAIMLLQTSDPTSIPSPEIVLRLLRKREGQEPVQRVNHQVSKIFGLIKLTEVPLRYQSRGSSSEKSEYYISSIRVITENAQKIYQMEQTGEDGTRFIAKVRAEDWRPILIERYGATGQRICQIVYHEQQVFFDIPEQKIQKTIHLKDPAYDTNTLFYLFRAFPFEENEPIEFNVVIDGRNGAAPGVFKMYTQVICREEVVASGKTYDCFKLEMGVRGVPAVFTGKYRFYFWYTVDEPHYLVKYEDKMGGLTLLSQ